MVELTMAVVWAAKGGIADSLFLALIGLVAMNACAESRSVAHSAAEGLVDCNIHDLFSLCFAGSHGYPARDLFVEYF
jgi:hypothetical protein